MTAMKSGKQVRSIDQPVDTSGPRRSLPNTLDPKVVSPSPAMNKDYIGSDFNDFLREEGIFEEVEAGAIKKVASYLTEQQAMDILLTPAAQGEMLQEAEQVSAELEAALRLEKVQAYLKATRADFEKAVAKAAALGVETRGPLCGPVRRIGK